MNLGRAQHLMDAGQYDAAVAALGPVNASTGDPRAALTLARIRESRGDLPGALAELDQLRTARPDYAPGHLFYGIFAGDAARFEASASALDRVLELQPANDVARSYRALAYLQLGQDQQALAIFRADGFSDNRMFRVRLTAWMEQQWLDCDRFFARRAVTGFPEPSAPLSGGRFSLQRTLRERRATKLFQAKRFPEMIRELDPLARESVPDEGVLFTCALGAEMVHDYERALGYIQRLPQDDGNWPDTLLAARARTLIRLRRFAEAASDLNRVEVIGPEDYGANYYFGVLCLAHGDSAQARRLFLRAHTQYLIDTLEYQWWQIEQALLSPEAS